MTDPVHRLSLNRTDARGGAARPFRPRISELPHDGRSPLWAAPAPKPSVSEEREHRKRQLAVSLRLLARNGVESGLAGHVSARDPEHTDHFWVNPLAIAYDQIRVSDLIRIDSDGQIVEGEGLVNVSGIAYHQEVQRARPRAVGIVHTHSFHAKTWSAFGRPLPALTADALAFQDEQVVFTPDRPESQPEAEARDVVAAQFTRELGERNVLIWRNHGLWTVGDTVESAAWRFIAFENAARGQLLAQAAGQPDYHPPAVGSSAERREIGAWLSFLPLYDQVARDEPDVFD
jgi:L-ribulose-5-phosphate 4-epimerase